jgi:hypothetical protein
MSKRSEAEEETSGAADMVTVNVKELKPEGYEGTCLRPLGLCELGGCCDVCWYNPDHPRFKKQKQD